ncbi:protein DpdE [Kribbella flavida]|uniref:protein DpdE n=1 Tax=Kribbella flavida TaxID=182640 RepID=UPI002351E5BA|nr:protein DpdE [Kribbella flavida]
MTFPASPGIGRVAAIDGGRVRVDFFESAAEPVIGSVWVAANDVRRVPLGEQTRVFFRDRHGRWRAGRIVGGGPDTYFVRVPNLRLDVEIPEDRLRVRWERVPHDPLQVLLSGANETPRFRDAREPVRRLLLAERAATASATGIMSAGVRMHAHQISAALRIIRDPVQRYLLADEVGMGKTIQAGMVMRQVLIDAPGRRIGIIVPDALVAQWQAELRDKFYLDDFPTVDAESPVQVLGHGEPERWSGFDGVDLLVVDEAHLLARTPGPDASPYRELAAVAHAAPRVLMLSATPFSRGAVTHLALLHLLDPQLFRWKDQESFERLLETRHALALAVFGLDEEPDVDNPDLLQLQLDEIREQLPEDETLRSAIQRAMDVYGPPGTPPDTVDEEALRLAVAAVRTHVSETYRLHHRVIRNRRHMVDMQRLDDEGLLTPFEFTGRTRPKVVRLDTDEVQVGAKAMADWVAGCAAAILDDGLDATLYGPVAGLLFSRLGGSVDDLCAVLEHRVSGTTTPGLLSAEEAVHAAAPTLQIEAEVLADLRAVRGADGLDALAAAIAKRSKAPAKAIVFCGRGSLAGDLADRIPVGEGMVKHVHAHLGSQVEAEREQATAAWLADGGVLVVDETGDVGRNFQEADLAFHIRIPGNPNALEQRIGRLDRYGNQRAAQQFVVADDDRDGISTAWLTLLVNGFGIFDASTSAFQEVADKLAGDVWTALLTDGVEALLERSEPIKAALLREKRRINELDALEASFNGQSDGEEMARAIAAYEEDSAGIENAYRKLIEGDEGYRFVGNHKRDGSISFERDYQDKPLLSDRLLARLISVENARTGFFDRWSVTPARRLFRRGNPFIDGLELLLDLDDRGQAVAMWRLDSRWPGDPLAFFGFDFLIEADLEPILTILDGQAQVEPIARRRADAAFPPQHQRVWVPVSTREPVAETRQVGYLNQPFVKGRDVNLNLERIPALHTLVGGEQYLAPIAEECFAVARTHVDRVADVVATSRRAAARVSRETEMLLAQSRARARAAGLVADPAALEAEVAMSRAIQAGVSDPLIRLSGVSCMVASAQSWADYV